MKKTLLFLTALFLYNAVNAQLTVRSDGRVSINNTSSSGYTFQVNGNNNLYTMSVTGGRNQLQIFNRGEIESTGTTTRNGIFMLNKTDSIDTYGIRMFVSGDGTGSSYGIKSLGGKSSFLSCGVMGGLSDLAITCGAGVIGSSSATTNLHNSQYSGKYAGFFDGDVRVTGTLYGSLLTPTMTSGQQGVASQITSRIVSSSSDAAGESVSEKLRQVSLIRMDLHSDPSASSERGEEPSESELLKSLTQRVENGEELTDEELADLERELEEHERTLSHMESPRTQMSSTRYGLAADQLRDVYPELVYEDANGNVSVNYIEMVPLLVQSVNELQERISVLEEENESLRSALGGDDISVKSRDAMTGIDTSETEVLSLSQNDPNPFSERTTISLTIPEGVSTAAVFFYDMSGKQIAKRVITERGRSQLSVSSGEFGEGMYLYSLIADGKVIATRKMILTK